MKFSIRTLLLVVTLLSIAVLLVRNHLRPDLSICDTDQINFDEHALVYGTDENAFRWGIVFTNDEIDIFKLPGTKNGYDVSVKKDIATITGPHGQSEIQLNDGGIIVFEGGKVLSRNSRVDGINIKKHVFANSAFNSTIIAFDIELPDDLKSQIGLDAH